ncbi:hypothetical protein SAMN02746095_01244 [Acidocella aminolytica 101 = DSM 11237]|nr:hypothetical protein SAMN02746095_01244 [Acidocella aminolytica 101 = DSM 11237]
MGSTPNPRRPFGRRFEAAIFMADNRRRHLTPAPIGINTNGDPRLLP